ncbi:MAG: Fic family protein [Faecalibacterium prausnitzii]
MNISKRVLSSAPQMASSRVSSAIFRRLAEQNFFQSLSFDDFVDAFVDFYIRTNELHPFREGNGRTQRVFLAQLAQHAGYQLIFPASTPTS